MKNGKPLQEIEERLPRFTMGGARLVIGEKRKIYGCLFVFWLIVYILSIFIGQEITLQFAATNLEGEEKIGSIALVFCWRLVFKVQRQVIKNLHTKSETLIFSKKIRNLEDLHQPFSCFSNEQCISLWYEMKLMHIWYVGERGAPWKIMSLTYHHTLVSKAFLCNVEAPI